MEQEWLFNSLTLLPIILVCIFFISSFVWFRLRTYKLKKIIPSNVALYDYVIWSYGKKPMINIGILLIKDNALILIDSNGKQVFVSPLEKTHIKFINPQYGFTIQLTDKQYNVRLDFGGLVGLWRVTNRYDLWAKTIEGVCGVNFLKDRNAVSRTLFSTNLDRFLLALVIMMAVTVFMFLVLA